MLVDASLYYNEADLFALRYAELADKVDLFVVVESLQTFQGHMRERCQFESNDYPGVRYAQLASLPGRNAWEREASLRNAILAALDNVPPDAMVMVSDADEIPAARSIPRVLPGLLSYFEQDFYYYSFNWRLRGKWLGTRIAAKSTLDLLSPQGIRARGDTRITDGGWHFSYFGGVESIADKLAAFSHQEYNRPPFTSREHILAHVEKGADLFDRDKHTLEYVEGMAHLPSAVYNQPERWAKHFSEREKC